MANFRVHDSALASDLRSLDSSTLRASSPFSAIEMVPVSSLIQYQVLQKTSFYGPQPEEIFCGTENQALLKINLLLSFFPPSIFYFKNSAVSSAPDNSTKKVKATR